MSSADIHAAILFEPDGYRTDIERLMGRQSAGNGFLRAAVAAAKGKALAGYTPRQASAESFVRTVREIDPAAKAQWLNPARRDLLGQIGHLYLPGPGLAKFALERLRAGPHAWSLTGVTHTTASHGVMDELTALPAAPVMPWDAIVCTSRAVRATVDTVLRAQNDYLKWRFGGADLKWSPPQLPVIPLGVHCADFRIDGAQRAAARSELGIADDEVAFLFVGRLSFHAKAHPHAMYAGLQAAAKASGRKIVLVQCGWFANESIESSFREGAKAACPDVRCLFTDGRAAAARASSWAAADVFISLSDNIQETFGLTPIEAMAAGLPVVVTDWDGYKDTVRDGVDGFRVRTWTPPAGSGVALAAAHELGADNYDMYCGVTCMHVAVDGQVLAERLTALASDAQLRKRMGDAGRERALESFDWAVIYGGYQHLWSELDKLRHKAAPDAKAPRSSAARLDPFQLFAHYPTRQISAATRVMRAAADGVDDYRRLAKTGLFNFAQRVLPGDDATAKLWEALGESGSTVESLFPVFGGNPVDTVRAIAVLAKMGIVRLEASPA